MYVSYNLSSQEDVRFQKRASVNTSNFGTNSLKYLATKVWDVFPCDISLIENLELFKKKIRKWVT